MFDFNGRNFPLILNGGQKILLIKFVANLLHLLTVNIYLCKKLNNMGPGPLNVCGPMFKLITHLVNNWLHL